MAKHCKHLTEVQKIQAPQRKVCEECANTGDKWVHLRICVTCGHIGCCDSSKNEHATKHFQATKHPVVKSLELGEDWGYCYEDDDFIERY